MPLRPCYPPVKSHHPPSNDDFHTKTLPPSDGYLYTETLPPSSDDLQAETPRPTGNDLQLQPRPPIGDLPQCQPTSLLAMISYLRTNHLLAIYPSWCELTPAADDNLQSQSHPPSSHAVQSQHPPSAVQASKALLFRLSERDFGSFKLVSHTEAKVVCIILWRSIPQCKNMDNCASQCWYFGSGP